MKREGGKVKRKTEKENGRGKRKMEEEKGKAGKLSKAVDGSTHTGALWNHFLSQFFPLVPNLLGSMRNPAGDKPFQLHRAVTSQPEKHGTCKMILQH